MCLHAAYQGDKVMVDMNMAFESMQHLTVGRVVHYLTYIFNCGTQEILSEKTVTTPINFATNRANTAMLASRTSIWFWGGPPGQVDWYVGTLLHLLIDRLFYCVAKGYSNIVDKFLVAFQGRDVSQIIQFVC